jgi:AcrR family transcriptional regulator
MKNASANPTADSLAPTKAEPPRRRDGRGEKRRRRIYKSLHDCIINKGYVKSTLADIAEGAGMTASHLLYYFTGKEAILEQYFANVSVRFLEKIESFSQHPPQQQIQLLADFWFRGETSTRLEIGFMLECFGAAVNDDALRITKADFDSRCKAHLVEIFLAAPALVLDDASDSAEIAYSMMIGLRSAVYFDEDISLERAHRLFTNTVNRMCGFDAPANAD